MASAGRAARLFVGNIPWTANGKDLRKYFSEFDYVVAANVVFDRNTGISKGYGFVTFGNPSAYDAIKDVKNHILEGNILVIQPAN